MSKIKLSEPNKYDENGWAPIHLFAASGRNNLITKFVEAGADLNSVIITDEPGMSVSAIVLAIREGHTDTTMLLAKLGADINSAGKGMTPLFYAIQHPEKALELTQGLLAQGADSSVLTQVIAKHGDAVLLQLGAQEAVVDSLVKIIKDHDLAEQAPAAEGEALPLEVEISALSLQTPEEFKDPEVEYLGGVEQPDGDL